MREKIKLFVENCIIILNERLFAHNSSAYIINKNILLHWFFLVTGVGAPGNWQGSLNSLQIRALKIIVGFFKKHVTKFSMDSQCVRNSFGIASVH